MSSKALKTGIFGCTPYWEILLNTVGVSYRALTQAPPSLDDFAVILLNNRPDDSLRVWLDSFVSHGGVIIESGHSKTYFSGARSRRCKYLRSSQNLPGAGHIQEIAVFSQVGMIPEAQYFDGCIHLPAPKDDSLLYFGLDPDAILSDTRYVRRRFPGTGGFEPDELVSASDKGAFVSLFEAVLKDAYIRQGLPFVQKWCSPGKNPVFAFRIDSDYGDQTSVTGLARMAENHSIPLTWFLHVAAHKDWLNVFKGFTEDEVSLHSYEHATSASANTWTENIRKGLKYMEDAGLHPAGFCAPYGIWNDGLNKALKAFNFTYTSEFTVAYDCLPVHIDPMLPVQMPVHPVCTGSLSRLNASEDDMYTYFSTVLQEKLSRFEPVLFYHHPLQKGLKMWDRIFSKLDQYKVTPITFGEYASFWKKREGTSLLAYINHEHDLKIETDNDVIIRVWNDHHRFTLIDGNSTVNMSTLKPDYEIPTDISSKLNRSESSLEQKLKLLKTSIIDWRNRKYL